MWRGRPTWVEVDLDAIADNVRALKAWVGPQVELMAVVKANAYGHGVVPVARVVIENGATRLAIACVDEGVQLRQAGVTAPILVLGYSPAWEAPRIVAGGLTPTVNTWELALALAETSAAMGVVTPVHVKIDTGMGRFGLLPDEALGFVQGLVALPGLSLEGIWTHFASADESDKSYTYRQMRVFREVLNVLKAHGISARCHHAANSAATLDMRDAHLDMVRCGIVLYGISPSAEVSRGVKLRPALSWKSRVGRLRCLPAGSAISYNCTFTTDCSTNVALVPVGYADGLSRRLSNNGEFLVRGSRARILGRVCMDQCVVAVVGTHGVCQDDEVVLIGRQNGAEITADELAARCDTVAYEVVCGIGNRVPRLYFQGGRLVAVDNGVTLHPPPDPAS